MNVVIDNDVRCSGKRRGATGECLYLTTVTLIVLFVLASELLLHMLYFRLNLGLNSIVVLLIRFLATIYNLETLCCVELVGGRRACSGVSTQSVGAGAGALEYSRSFQGERNPLGLTPTTISLSTHQR